LVLVLALLFASCSQTRYVSQDEYLIQKVDVDIDNKTVDKTEAKSFLRQKENYKILGFMKFYLWLYNLSSKKKTDGWLKRIGEAPQLYDQAQADHSIDLLKMYMDHRGYYQAHVEKEVELNDKKQKAYLKYSVETGEQYKIRNVNYHFKTPELKAIFFKDSSGVEIKSGAPFDIYNLEDRQEKIVKMYQNKGYYFFSKNQVRYLADTLLYGKNVDVDLFIGEIRGKKEDSTKILKPYKINNLYYSIVTGTRSVLDDSIMMYEFSDTLHWDNSYLYESSITTYPKDLLERTNQIESGDWYNTTNVENTFSAFNRLKQFRFVDVKFNEAYQDQDSNKLDCQIRLAPLKKQSTSFDIEGTNTSGNLGVAGNIYYQHRNLFKGAEVFQIRLKGAVERIHRTDADEAEYFNSRELGIETSLTIPKLLGPGKFIKSFEKNLPKTILNVGYNFQQRPEYTRTITNFTFGYNWKTTQDISHTVNVLDLNLVRLYEFDSDFINSIEDLYIKSSYTDHLIFAINYSLVYNNQRSPSNKNYTYSRLNLESSGNLLSALCNLTDKSKATGIDTTTNQTVNYYELFNIQFAQFLKADIEVRRSFQLDRFNSVVGRFFAGVGFPYGNSTVMPYEKQYFSGGANGIRAWQVRSLGPGTYEAPDGSYPNQSSDIKLEANAEYRFHLLSKLEGAFFVDAGNIWAINQNDNRDGAIFKFDQFYKQIAVGTGVGFRWDFSYFIARMDIGMKLCIPSEPEGERWLFGNRNIDSDDFAFSFAIGYPF
jgi:outer membrane protein assembly factor BamA